MKKLILLLSAIVALSLMPAVSFADDFEAAGEAYEKGDYQTAFKIWKPLADKGDAQAQYNLGFLYENGQGVLQNYTKAAKYYSLAAEQNYVSAQNNLGVMYKNGQGVLQNYTEAVKYLRLAAEQNHADAQNNLGVMYYNGKGVKQNNILAHMWVNISLFNDPEYGAEFRDEISEKMTQDEITKAQKLAQQCLDSEYKNCAE